jgi:hypothetical protein
MTATGLDAGAGPAAYRKSARSALAVLGFLYLLVGAYVEPPLPLRDGLILPSFTTVLALPLLLLVMVGTLRRRDIVLLASVAALLLTSAVLSPGTEWIPKKVLGMAQTLVAMTGGLLLFKLTDWFSVPVLRRVLAAAWLFLLLSATLEVMGVLRPAVVAFGEAVYRVGGYKFYSADVRDLSILGFPRPEVFTSEPSLVAIAFYVLLTGWLALRATLPRLLVGIAAATAMLSLVGSPVLVIAVAVLCLVYVRLGPRSLLRSVPSLAVAATALLLVPILIPGVVARLGDRLDEAVINAATLAPTSENLRLVIPAVTTAQVLAGSPVFGVGISGKEVIGQFSTLPGADFAGNAQFGNSFALFLSYLGVAGAVVFVGILRRWMRESGVRYGLVCAVVLIGLSQAMGGFETPRFWAYVFLILAVYRAASPNAPGGASPEGASDSPPTIRSNALT